MNIAHVLMYMFPGTDTPKDWQVSQVDGEQFISAWFLENPQPSTEEIIREYEEMLKVPPEPEPPTIEERLEALEAFIMELKNA
ncbi:XkdW family protein [Bacillus spongiae]|uniref:XkdW family protein n=1 Tax=Bacillus spongiae TaxID=2683610 RepID=A0ABU8HK25_9BACI